ncbi:hypothetical protein HDU98_005565 [Podochytrium sp. JEL0797]|nr:hypothetical protein HDU98_005565 [Podochytrium sp. JEL0797]
MTSIRAIGASAGDDAPLPSSAWSVFSKTASALPGFAVSFEGAFIEGVGAKQDAVLVLVFDVRNLAYAKRLVARHTSNAWKSYADSSLAEFCGSFGNGIDRFAIRIALDELDAQKVKGINHRVLVFEFAVCCDIGGWRFWDNRYGLNHCVVIHLAPCKVASAPKIPFPLLPIQASNTLPAQDSNTLPATVTAETTNSTSATVPIITLSQPDNIHSEPWNLELDMELRQRAKAAKAAKRDPAMDFNNQKNKFDPALPPAIRLLIYVCIFFFSCSVLRKLLS